MNEESESTKERLLTRIIFWKVVDNVQIEDNLQPNIIYL